MVDEDNGNPEAETVAVVYGGEEITIERDSRLHKQIQRLVEETQAEAFADKRAMFLEAVQPGIMEQSNGFEGVLDGMTLVWNFATEAPILHRSELIKLGQRKGKAKE